MAEPIRLLIIDDHRIVREGLKTFLAPNPRMQIIGEGQDGREAVELASRLKPDVVLMDLVMPGMDGIEATRQITACLPQARVLIITSFTEEERVMGAIQVGAAGYLLKDSSPQILEEAIEAVYRGESYLPPSIARKVIHSLRRPEETTPAALSLTPREIEIVKLVAMGYTNEEIASAIYISPRTVSSHLWRLMRKIQADNRTQVAIYAFRHGIAAQER
jgi:NarL family two-component system response regulator LiaR